MFICPKCERTIGYEKQWHNCVKIEIDSLFNGKADELIYVFDRILAEVIDWEKVAVSATKNCIVFIHNKTFLVVKPMKTVLDVKFNTLEKMTEEDDILKSAVYAGKYENHIRLSNIDEVTPKVFKYIKGSYNIS